MTCEAPLKPYAPKFLESLVRDLDADEPEYRNQARQLFALYYWGKPVEFEPSETEEAKKLEAALQVVKAMSPEEKHALVRGEAGLPAVENGSIGGVKPKVKA